MRVAWLADTPAYIGGAEMSQQEFLAAAPEGVEVIKCDPGEIDANVDRVVAHNVVLYSLADLQPLRAKPISWFHHDLSPHIDPEVKAWLDDHADHIFCSPLQRDKYGAEGICIPPALDLDSFKPQSKKRRKGTCSIAQWRNSGKGTWLLEEWAATHGPVDVYGEGELLPVGPGVEWKGPLAPDKVAQCLRKYERFVFLPAEVEPFCRTVAEAWAAGCRLVVNQNIGALHWIREAPGALENVGERFWEVVMQ